MENKRTRRKPKRERRARVDTTSQFYGTGELNFGRRPCYGNFICPETALRLPAMWAAIRLYQRTFASLPLVSYTKDANGGRTRLKDKALFSLLHDRPNPGQSRAAFFKQQIKDYFLYGECFAWIQWAGNNRPLNIFPVPAKEVVEVKQDEDWNKNYVVQTRGGRVEYEDFEIIHLTHFSHDGLRGTPFIRFAAENLTLHKQIQDSAVSYYENSINPSCTLNFPNKVSKEAATNLKDQLKEGAGGPQNRGNPLVITEGGKFEPYPNSSAEDAQILEALGLSTTAISQWTELTPLQLGDYSRGTYSNLASDNLAFYQRVLRPLLNEFELEYNAKLFGVDSDNYCEFLTQDLLKADPMQQANIWHLGIQDGYYLRSEVRAWQNLPPVEGLDQPIHLLNMGQSQNMGQPQEDNAISEANSLLPSEP